MEISSTILALNYQRNFDEITNAENYLICVIDEEIEKSEVHKIERYFSENELGKILPIIFDKDNSAFSTVFEDIEKLDNLLKRLKRLLWEAGVLLSTKIVLVNPEIRILKDYGIGE